MAFDFKKEYKEFYMPKNQPQIVNVPKANYIAVRGTGDPNEEGGAYQQAISVLYSVAYTLKMSYKTDYKIEGFFEYVVPPLEGFWWQEDREGFNYKDKSAFHWISVIRLPDFVTKKDFEWAVETATKKKKLDCSSAEFLTIEEGLCVQIMHLGSYDDEPATIAIMDEYLKQNGYVNDLTKTRLHHEIYMSDARRVAPEKWKTVIRHPIRKMTAKKVAFICVHNSCRSQIAEALGKHLAADVFESYSAGTETKPQMNQDAVRIMKEMYGIDMEQTQYSKLITDIPDPDIAISMGCNVGCPFIGRAFDDNWGLEDPTGKSDEEFKRVIKEIENRILQLKSKVSWE